MNYLHGFTLILIYMVLIQLQFQQNITNVISVHKSCQLVISNMVSCCEPDRKYLHLSFIIDHFQNIVQQFDVR